MRSSWSCSPRTGARWYPPESRYDTGLLLRILGVAAGVPLLFRLKLSRVERLLVPTCTPAASDAAQVQRIIRSVEAVLRRGRPFVRAGCLTRGATLFYFLRRAGVAVTLRFGMGEVDGEFAGHCWLVKDGEPFLEKTDPRSRFTPTYDIPSSGVSSP